VPNSIKPGAFLQLSANRQLVTLPEEEGDREIGITIEVTIEDAPNLTIEEVKARAFDLAKQAMAAAASD
jgi:hypothetical protein